MNTLTVAQENKGVLETEQGINLIKDIFPKHLSSKLNLIKVSAPLFVKSGTGINDDLNGIEKPVNFSLKMVEGRVEIVQSLAKWKRIRLHELGIPENKGILTDMRAIRPDENISPIHSFYVDQWDWEKKISDNDRSVTYLKQTVDSIYGCILTTQNMLQKIVQVPKVDLPDKVFFIHAEELLKVYPLLTAKERENEIVKKHRAVFIIGIGGNLTNNDPHDGRAPDYDDWSSLNEDGFAGLNGDLLLWNPVLNCAFELSSMGIRVNPQSLEHQLQLRGCLSRKELHFHSRILNGTYPQSIGGGIGQSRLCMFLLQKQHIAQVQSGIWPEESSEQFKLLRVETL